MAIYSSTRNCHASLAMTETVAMTTPHAMSETVAMTKTVSNTEFVRFDGYVGALAVAEPKSWNGRWFDFFSQVGGCRHSRWRV